MIKAIVKKAAPLLIDRARSEMLERSDLEALLAQTFDYGVPHLYCSKVFDLKWSCSIDLNTTSMGVEAEIKGDRFVSPSEAVEDVLRKVKGLKC